MVAYQPDRGHFVHLNFDPQAGTEQSGRRPALVLSPLAYNVATGLALMCPVTSQMKGGAFDVAVPRGGKIKGVVLSDQIKCLDWIARKAEYDSLAPTILVEEVLARIESILQIDG